MRVALLVSLAVCAVIGGRDAAAQPAGVNADSLGAMVRFLTVDPATHALRSRFVLREKDIGAVADSLATRLERYTGNPVDRIPFLIHDHVYSNDSTFTAENIVARLGGTGALSGVFLVTAHYDAITARIDSFRQRWRTMSAPGADDNATGAAAVMELARSLPRGAFPFDVLFVLFSGEELGKLGSADFVSRFGSLYGETILGVINFDMLGYRPAQPAGDASRPVLLTDYRSGWLADMIAASAGGATRAVPFRVAKPGPSNYDHGSFWDREIPAVTITEPLTLDNFIVYPFMHTTADTISADIDFGFASTLAGAAGEFIAGVAASPADIAVLPSDMMLLEDTLLTGVRTFDVGDSIGVLVRVRNTGSAPVSANASIRLTVSIENAAGESVLFSGDIPAPEPLETSNKVLRLGLRGAYVGGNIVRARVDVEGMNDRADDDAAELAFGVRGPGATLVGHGFRPNPVDRAFRSARFCINLARAADVEIDLYSVEGERVAVGYAGSRWGKPLGAGLNCLSCGALFPAVDRLASGVYLYRLTLSDADGSTIRATGSFAVAH